MRRLFSPGVLLMNQLKYPQKFTLISVLPVLLIVVTLLLLTSRINTDIDVTNKGRAGLEYINSLRKLLESTQLHRGMTNAYLKGDTSWKDQLLSKQLQVEKDIKEIDEVDKKLGVAFDTDKQWNTIKKKWGGFKRKNRGWTRRNLLPTHFAD